MPDQISFSGFIFSTSDPKYQQAMKWFDTMPMDKRYTIDSRQLALAKLWAWDKDYDGGLHFNSDFTQIYKTQVPK